ncbi:hypothetical protein MTR_1g036650 [Medicago truncatula]|uniref:Uncharacterized protein n=1 Tax=Medicago truncatula TaxID=3880 RepID=A0A072VHK4_MEDTR|nr:hypothetical protein MTR_1g036650 [Medicago truncatula]
MATKDPPLVQQRPQPLCQPICMKQSRQQGSQRFIPQNQSPQPLIPQNQAQKASQCDPFPVKYADLLPILLKTNLVQTLSPPHVPDPLPPGPITNVQDPGYQPRFRPSQQQYLASHSVVAVRNPGYQPQFQQYQQQAPRTQINPIPMKYAELFPRLLERNLIHTKAPLSVPTIFPAGYRADLSYAFHQGAPGHDIEECFALQKIVQKLI